MCIFKTGFSSLSNDYTKYKAKVPNVSNPNQYIEITCNSKLSSLQNLKNLFIKTVQKN